jgi:hypothetical protein
MKIVSDTPQIIFLLNEREGNFKNSKEAFKKEK